MDESNIWLKNMEKELEQMVEDVRQKGYPIYGIYTKAEDLVFEERVKMNCFYCGKYNTNWKCPPQIPNIDYRKMILEFDHIAYIYVKVKIGKSNFEQVRRESNIYLHRALLECEKWLYQRDNSTALSFIGGSCRLCKNGCAPDKCANPYQSRTPVEALGFNVVKSAKQVGLEIVFPPIDYMMRVGLLLW